MLTRLLALSSHINHGVRIDARVPRVEVLSCHLWVVNELIDVEVEVVQIRLFTQCEIEIVPGEVVFWEEDEIVVCVE